MVFPVARQALFQTTVTKLAEQQQRMLAIYLEIGATEMQLMAQARDPKALLSRQAELSAEYSRQLGEIVRNSSDILRGCAKELSDWAATSTKAQKAPLKTKTPLV